MVLLVAPSARRASTYIDGLCECLRSRTRSPSQGQGCPVLRTWGTPLLLCPISFSISVSHSLFCNGFIAAVFPTPRDLILENRLRTSCCGTKLKTRTWPEPDSQERKPLFAYTPPRPRYICLQCIVALREFPNVKLLPSYVGGSRITCVSTDGGCGCLGYRFQAHRCRFSWRTHGKPQGGEWRMRHDAGEDGSQFHGGLRLAYAKGSVSLAWPT